MADKVKGKKSKTLSKKPSARVRKPEVSDEGKSEVDPELQEKPVRAKVEARVTPKTQESPSLPAAEAAAPFPPPLEQKFADHASPSIEAPEARLPKSNSAGFKPEAEELNVRLSRALMRKLKDQALDEGISLEEFVSELLAESVVLRAWEIVERKNQMKGQGNAPTGNNRNAGPSGPHNPNRGQRGTKGAGNRGGMNPLRYQNIMEDKATFLEYVRNQERNRR